MSHAASSDRPEPSVKRPPLLVLMLGAFGVGLLLMILFESAITRVLGLLCLFTFIVTGVFLIADPAYLGQDDDADGAQERADG